MGQGQDQAHGEDKKLGSSSFVCVCVCVCVCVERERDLFFIGTLSQEEMDLCHLVLQHLKGFPCIITIYEVVKIARVVLSSCFNNKH